MGQTDTGKHFLRQATVMLPVKEVLSKTCSLNYDSFCRLILY